MNVQEARRARALILLQQQALYDYHEQTKNGIMITTDAEFQDDCIKLITYFRSTQSNNILETTKRKLLIDDTHITIVCKGFPGPTANLIFNGYENVREVLLYNDYDYCDDFLNDNCAIWVNPRHASIYPNNKHNKNRSYPVDINYALNLLQKIIDRYQHVHGFVRIL